MKTKQEKSLLAITLVLFSIIIKFFASLPYCFISMDEAKYLKLALNIPRYVLFNKNFYISHPPFYPFVIKAFSLFMPDYISGLLVSQIGTAGFIIVAFLLMRILGIDYKIKSLMITFLGFSHLLYYWTNIIYKETFFTFLVFLFLLLFIQVLKQNKKKTICLSIIIGILLSLISDLVIFILPVVICIVYLYREDGSAHQKTFPLIILSIFSLFTGYILWIAGRWWIYTHNIYYPAGVDGLIEQVADWNIFHLFTPRGFQYTKAITQSGVSFKLAHYVKYIAAFFNFLPPFHISLSMISIKESILIVCLYIPLIILFVIGAYASLKAKEKTGYLMWIILLSFLFPVIFDISDPRFSLPCLLPIFYFIGKGIVTIKPSYRWDVFSSVVLIGFTIFWFLNNPYIFCSRQKVVQLEKTGKFFNNIREDGIMAQFGYPPELTYLTDKRVICLPIITDELEMQIKMYEINYIVIGSDETYSRNVIRYIKNNPQKFIKVKEIEEEYPNQKETIYVFKIKK